MIEWLAESDDKNFAEEGWYVIDKKRIVAGPFAVDDEATEWVNKRRVPVQTDDDRPTICGYIYTHFDCDCGEVFEFEGDASGDVVRCNVCNTEYRVGEMR